MKAFIISHGEKLVLVVVALVAGWSLFSSLKSLGATEHLPEKDIQAIKKIAKELKDKKAPPKAVAPYGEWLQANLDGHGIYALTLGTVASPRVYEPPFMAQPPEDEKVVLGRIGLPGGLSAVSDRGRITFSWTAPAMIDSNMRIVRYEVLRREEGGAWAAAPVYAASATSFVDRKVRPETEYAYKVRVAGVPAPPKEGTIVNPQAPPLVRQGGVWLTAFVGGAGNVNAMTPSNIDFECSNVFSRFGEKYANIIIKRWNSEEDDWQRFKTEPGIRVGEKVVGTRSYGIGRTRKEAFDSGYVLKKIIDEIREIEVWVWVFVEDPPGSGNVVKKRVKKMIPKRVQEIVLEKVDGSQKLIVPVGRGATTREKKPKDTSAAPAARPTAPPGGIDDMRKRFESRTGAAEVTKRPGRAAGPAGPAPSAAVRLEDARTSIRLTFPEGWSASDDMAADLGVGAGTAMLLNDGKVTVYKGTVAKSGVVIADKPLNDDEKRVLLNGTRRKLEASKEASLLAKGLLRIDKEVIAGIEAMGGVRTKNTDAGKVVGTYAFIFTEGQDRIAVTRYCATSPGHLYVLSFVCGEKDLGVFSEDVDKIVSSWTW